MTNRSTMDKSQSKQASEEEKVEAEDQEFTRQTSTDDDHARIRRRAPTRHSIKSLSGRKTVSKQTSNPEVK